MRELSSFLFFLNLIKNPNNFCFLDFNYFMDLY